MLNKPFSRRSFIKISAMAAASMALDWNRISAHAAKMGSPETYVQLLSRHFPDEAGGIRGFVEKMIAIASEVNQLSRNRGKFIRLLFPLQCPAMWHVRNLSLADLVNEHVANPEVQNILTALWGYYGLPPSRLSGFYYANATGDYLKNGSYYIKERSQDLSNAIAEVIKIHGGKILYDSPAGKIRVKDGAVEGVELEGGETLPARAVVSNGSALATFQEMLPADIVPPDYLALKTRELILPLSPPR